MWKRIRLAWRALCGETFAIRVTKHGTFFPRVDVFTDGVFKNQKNWTVDRLNNFGGRVETSDGSEFFMDCNLNERIESGQAPE